MGRRSRDRDNPSPSSPAAGPDPRALLWGWVTGIGLCFAALIVVSVALGGALRSTTRGYHPVKAPGTTALELKKPGFYVGMYNHKGDGPVPVQELASLDITLGDAETGAYVPLERGMGAQAFEQGGARGAVLLQFEAPHAGKYVFNAEYPAGRSGPAVELMVLHESLQQNRADIAAGVILMLVLGGFGVYVLVRTARAAAASKRP